MRVLSLELEQFRNYAALRFSPPGGACVFIGENAQGKSNLLEALALLSTGKSFRAARESDLIREGAPAASVSADVRTRHGEARATCLISRVGDGARKKFLRDGRSVSYGQFIGGVAAVTFMPLDLQLVGGPAGLRRRLLNASLAQCNRPYYRDLAAYAGVLAQKNAMLRAPAAPDRELFATYNEQLAETGARIAGARAAYVRKLATEAGAVHARWVGASPELGVAYRPTPAYASDAPDAIANTLRAALTAAAPFEAKRRVALVGPHRDDIALTLGGRSLARFGSQGQQRTAVLALKAAEYALLHAAAGEPPVLLLDDVLSELDAARRFAFLSSLDGFDQAFITATELPDLPRGVLGSVVEIRGGVLEPANARPA
ncbi:MAG TPA: DNA replication and repair protein RecF [Casimicrobiaceae bacterium]